MITKINEKINTLSINSDQKLSTAKYIAENSDFATATALLITAFEERAKAVVLQLYDIGFPIVSEDEHLDYIFRQHDARHYIGFYVDCLSEIIDDIIPLLDRFRTDKEYMFRVLKFDLTTEMESEFFKWVSTKIDSFLIKIDFYQNIERTRQNGLYKDVLDNGTLNKVITFQDYTFIKSRLDPVHAVSEDLKRIKSNKEQNLMDSLKDSIEEMENQKMAEHISNAIFLVKEKRNRVFNDIRKKLIEFKNHYTTQN